MLEIEITFSFLPPELEDLIMAELVLQGFEGAWIDNRSIKAYITKDSFDEQSLKNVLQSLSVSSNYSIREVSQTNWNALWESTFEPVVIFNKLLIRAPFHKITDSYPIEIVIQPNMAFGTGHHPTTYLIAEYLLQCDVNDKIVIDAGTGTGILAILAEKLGAQKVYAIDIDDVAVQSSKENIELNACNKIQVTKASITDLQYIMADYLIANINRNVLISEMPEYAKRLHNNGVLIISGFLNNDVPILIEKSEAAGLTVIQKIEKNGWYGLVLKAG